MLFLDIALLLLLDVGNGKAKLTQLQDMPTLTLIINSIQDTSFPMNILLSRLAEKTLSIIFAKTKLAVILNILKKLHIKNIRENTIPLAESIAEKHIAIMDINLPKQTPILRQTEEGNAEYVILLDKRNSEILIIDFLLYLHIFVVE